MGYCFSLVGGGNYGSGAYGGSANYGPGYTGGGGGGSSGNYYYGSGGGYGY